VERLRGYNPPDRTVDDQRQIAVDIHEAADRIEALETALRKIAHGEYLEHETIGVALEHARSTAQAALAPEQDK
jgi:hypothetical protein